MWLKWIHSNLVDVFDDVVHSDLSGLCRHHLISLNKKIRHFFYKKIENYNLKFLLQPTFNKSKLSEEHEKVIHKSTVANPNKSNQERRLNLLQN